MSGNLLDLRRVLRNLGDELLGICVEATSGHENDWLKTTSYLVSSLLILRHLRFVTSQPESQRIRLGGDIDTTGLCSDKRTNHGDIEKHTLKAAVKKTSSFSSVYNAFSIYLANYFEFSIPPLDHT